MVKKNDIIEENDLNLDDTDLDALESISDDSQKTSQKSDAQKTENPAKKQTGLPVKKGKVSWKPSNKTDIEGKDPRFSYRLFNSSIPGRIEQKGREGWEVDQDNNIKTTGLSIRDGGSKGSVNSINELVLMKMPKELAEARRQYYKNKQITAETLQSNFYNKQGVRGGEAYGSIEMS